jgi:hypothetical protein
MPDNHTLDLRSDEKGIIWTMSAVSRVSLAFPTEFLRKLEERSLGLATNKYLIGRVGLVVLESHRIDCISLIEKVL